MKNMQIMPTEQYFLSLTNFFQDNSFFMWVDFNFQIRHTSRTSASLPIGNSKFNEALSLTAASPNECLLY